MSIETPQSQKTELVDIHTDTALQMAYIAGNNDRLVVSFSGVGKKPSVVPPFELTGAASQDGENHVLLIIDPLRRWFNDQDYVDTIRETVHKIVADKNIKTVAALGNSMGGFMAIVFAEIYKVDVVVALCPQFSMNPEIVPEETRWHYHQAEIQNWLFPHVGELAAEGTAYYIFHGDSEDEKMHWSKFPTGANIYHYVLSDVGHNVARKLKERKILKTIIKFAIENRPHVIRNHLERGGFKPERRSNS